MLLTDAPDAYRLETRSIEGLRGQLRRLEPALGAWRAEGFRVRLLAPDPKTAERLQEILRDLEHEVPVVSALLGPEPLAVLVGGAHVGFECPGLGLVCLTETELFGHRRTMRRRPTYQRGAAIAAFTDLAPGDLVVHVEHGIGRYAGLVTLAVDGQPADYLLLEYAEGARLYLPVQRMAAVTKYTGSGNEAPRLDKLGATTWQRTKESGAGLPPGDGAGAPAPLCRAAGRRRARGRPRHALAARVRSGVPVSRRRRTSSSAFAR